ncbi:ribosomal L29e protein family-domain-containing protein, partial [Peziza echinospora]
ESKNSSQHNQSKKAHKNGITKIKSNRYPSLKGVDPKFKRNHKHALHGTQKALVRTSFRNPHSTSFNITHTNTHTSAIHFWRSIN